MKAISVKCVVCGKRVASDTSSHSNYAVPAPHHGKRGICAGTGKIPK